MCLLLSCNEREQISTNSTDQILDIIINNSDGINVEFLDLDKDQVINIPEDKYEKSILAEKLKLKGFKVVNWGRGNFPPLGPRIINLTLKKSDCECEVSKMYYSTTDDTLYSVREKIKCRKVK